MKFYHRLSFFFILLSVSCIFVNYCAASGFVSTPSGSHANDKILDSDGDGVADTFDWCSDSPPGVLVDSRGCPNDRDSDGVPDYRDICPETPTGTEVDRVGCVVGEVMDSDGDGVDDSNDKCVETPNDIPVNRHGCPQDSDGDMVFNFEDSCPDTTAGIPVDATGCPLTEALTLYLDLDLIFSTSIRNGSYSDDQQLVRVAEFLKENPFVSILVEGHTESVGSGVTNMKISQVWAEHFRSYLIKRYGIDPTRITARGFGATRPLGAKALAKGWTSNRRVVVVLRQD